jgi:hypothetical protein
MSSFYTRLTDATIAAGNNASRIISSKSEYHDAAAIAIFSPSTLDAHTFVIEVNESQDATASSTWKILEDSSGNPVGVPAAGRARWYPELASVGAFRIRDNTGNVAADRTFAIGKTWTTQP